MRQGAILTLAIAAYAGLVILLMSDLGLTSAVAGACSGLACWSAMVLVVSERALGTHLTLRDYHAMHQFGTFLLIGAGNSAAFALPGLPTHSLVIIALLALLPVLAVQALAGRALFTADERATFKPSAEKR